MTNLFKLVPGKLSLDELRTITTNKDMIYLDESADALIRQSTALVNKVIEDNKTVYGINTGFGSLANQIISKENLKQLQRNIVLSHACGTGDLLSDEVVSLILLLKINSLAQGFSGIRKEIIDALILFYNKKMYPCIPAKGSVGASGDLVPLAHLSLPLIGEGHFHYEGQIISAKEGLRILNMEPIELGPKEGLALLNGLQVSAALCLKALFDTELLFKASLIAAGLSIDAARGSIVPFDARIHQVRGYSAQMEVASKIKRLLKGSEILGSHKDCDKVQDPYSLRCQPQVMGAIFHQMSFVSQTLAIEINSVSDNPLIFSKEGDILSGGNFHGEMIAMAADNLSLAIAELGAISERKIALLIDKHFSGLPAFLTKESGLNSGFMIAHVTAAALASDNKALVHPHSVDSLPTSANQEDHVSMATNAANRLFPMIENTSTIIGIELLAACQGIDFHRPLKTSKELELYHAKIRHLVPVYEQDRYFAPDIALVKKAVLNPDFCEGIDLNYD